MSKKKKYKSKVQKNLLFSSRWKLNRSWGVTHFTELFTSRKFRSLIKRICSAVWPWNRMSKILWTWAKKYQNTPFQPCQLITTSKVRIIKWIKAMRIAIVDVAQSHTNKHNQLWRKKTQIIINMQNEWKLLNWFLRWYLINWLICNRPLTI